MKSLIYDGSFDGFLTAVFTIYEMKYSDVCIRTNENYRETFFGTIETIITDIEKAKRVWKGIRNNAGTEAQNLIFKCYLSEIPDIEDALLHYIEQIFNNVKDAAKNYADDYILTLSKTEKKINREKHRMDAFIRFKKTKDDIYFATVEPDFNVLPLNLKHFKNRYADQKWLIYDLKRKYGIYYDLNKVETVQLNLEDTDISNKNADLIFSEDEMDFQDLWKNYFDSTNIKSRKNMRLHIQHVPKRYWKYLSEKRGLN